VGSLTLSGGFVFDATGSAPFRADVRVEDGRIAEIGADLDGDESVDATGRTILPGLIDCHAHVAYADLPRPEEAVSRTATYSTLQAIAGLHATLAATQQVRAREGQVGKGWTNSAAGLHASTI